mmetsp:Transcript_145929/g.467808  ORF Transcript_145929/g.467808 Transcript_145929/m.467808 type:complete len:399 (+) Transcript_145929:877-2073(+)
MGVHDQSTLSIRAALRESSLSQLLRLGPREGAHGAAGSGPPAAAGAGQAERGPAADLGEAALQGADAALHRPLGDQVCDSRLAQHQHRLLGPCRRRLPCARTHHATILHKRQGRLHNLVIRLRRRCGRLVGPLQSVHLPLLGQQVCGGDVHLLLHRVARQVDDLHAVQQWPVDAAEVVASAQEEHLGHIEWGVEIVVFEAVVLLRIQQFQHRTRRVELGIPRQLVDLVQEDDGVVDLHGDHGLDDGAGHAADVRPPVAPQLGFVADAAQGDAVELSAEGLRDGPAQRRFPDAGRTVQAENRPLHVPAHLLYGQELQDAPLHLLQAIMILLQHVAGNVELQVVLRTLGPRQGCQRLEVRARDGVLRMLWLDVLQPPQLPLGDLLRLWTELRLLQGVPQG